MVVVQVISPQSSTNKSEISGGIERHAVLEVLL